MPPITLDVSLLPDGLGAAKPLEFPATRYCQGRRSMYSLVLTVQELVHTLERPDADRPVEGNRRVDHRRARKFGEYIRAKTDWVSPAIIVRAPIGEEIKFNAVHSFPNGTAWGTLQVPLTVVKEIVLLDGQHRTLGAFLFLDEINERIRECRDQVNAAVKNDQPSQSLLEEATEGGAGCPRACAHRAHLRRYCRCHDTASEAALRRHR